jgi:hypothetical protein
MTTWAVGTTPDDHFAVYRDGERWFDAWSETGDAQPTKARQARATKASMRRMGGVLRVGAV